MTADTTKLPLRTHVTDFWDTRIRASAEQLAEYRREFDEKRELYNPSAIARMKERIDEVGKYYEVLRESIVAKAQLEGKPLNAQGKPITKEDYNPILHMSQAQFAQAARDEASLTGYFGAIYKYESLLPFVRMAKGDGDAAYRRHLEEGKARALAYLDAHPELEQEAGDRVLVVTSHRCNLSKLYIPDVEKTATTYDPPLRSGVIYTHKAGLYIKNTTDGGYEVGLALEQPDNGATPQTVFLRDGKVIAGPYDGARGTGILPIGKLVPGELMAAVATHMDRTPPKNAPHYFETLESIRQRLAAFASPSPNDDAAFLSKKQTQTQTPAMTREGAGLMLARVSEVWSRALQGDDAVDYAEFQAIRDAYNNGLQEAQKLGFVRDANVVYIPHDPAAEAEQQKIVSGLQADIERLKKSGKER
jgi:hypothetical protein